MLIWIALAIILGIAGMVLGTRDGLDRAIDGSGLAGIETIDLVVAGVGLMVAALALISVAAGSRGGFGRVLRDLVSWCVIVMAFVAGFNYRDDLMSLGHRVIGEMSPAGNMMRADAQSVTERAVKIRRSHDGHFIAKTDINGIELPMLVDTGASTVVLRPQDAQRLGLDPARLKYSVPVQTANGTTYAAPVRLKLFSVGSILFRDVDALVSKPGALRDSLLGMTFLNRLRSYEFSGEFLTLRI